ISPPPTVPLTPEGAAALAAADSLARHAAAPATLRAYKADWTHFSDWCAAKGFVPVPAAPEVVGAYLASLAETHATMLQRGGWADRRYHHIDCLSDPDVARASELQHPVQDPGGDADLGCLGVVSPGSKCVADHTFVSADRRLDFSANIVAAGFLPGHSAVPGDLLDVLVPSRGSGPG